MNETTLELSFPWTVTVKEFDKNVAGLTDRHGRKVNLTNQYRRRAWQPGVYVFSTDTQCLYVGSGVAMSGRALAHIRGHNSNSWVTNYSVTLNERIRKARKEGKTVTIEFIPCNKPELRFREMEEIVGRRPVLNKALPQDLQEAMVHFRDKRKA